MKQRLVRLSALALSSLLTCTAALADPPHRGPPPSHHHGSSYSHRYDWFGPLVLFGVTVGAISALNSRPAPPPVYVVTPAPPPPAPANVWYYCESAGNYYPYARYCPEGWQLVRPQLQ